MLISIWGRIELWLMEVVLLVVKIGLRPCRENWLIVILRAFRVAGKFGGFFKNLCCYTCSQPNVFSRQATGGSIPNILARLSNAELNVTQSTTNNGNMSNLFLS
jgi:hypothetical protein